MIDLNQVAHNRYLENIVDIVCARTGNLDKGFFRPVVAYFLSKVASNMRANLVTKDMGKLPINCYAICLGTSGYGKGHSINLIEDEFISEFKNRLKNYLLPRISEISIQEKAENICSSSDQELEKVLLKLKDSYSKAGEYLFSFDNGTVPAIKQLRNKLLLSNIGAISSEQDEIGNNLTYSQELLGIFLELFDLGKIKQKLIKNTNDNSRDIELDGRVPANLLLFGTPAKLFDSGETEDCFFSLLETGYARRCLFGYGSKELIKYENLSPKDVYLNKVKAVNSHPINQISNHIAELADFKYYQTNIEVPEEVGIALTEYKINCEIASQKYKDFEFIKKSELEHRYFKTIKLAGVFTFIDKRTVMTVNDLYEAIKLVEESGKSFEKFIKRDPDYVKVAKFILDSEREVTNAEIAEVYPFYKTQSKRKDILCLARAWGYRNNILIKQDIRDSIEFFSASKLNETNLNELLFSVSTNFAENFIEQKLSFDKLVQLCTGIKLNPKENLYWCNHVFKDNYRKHENVQDNFNVICFDCDGTVNLKTFRELFSNYKYFLYLTKSHTEESHHFRVILPIKYEMSLTREAYKEFMTNILKWLPFSVDSRVILPEQMWTSYYGSQYFINDGELLDPLPFVPRTSKHEEFIANRNKINKLTELQIWFLETINKYGNRNNNLFKYGCMLLDDGKPYEEVCDMVLELNNNLEIPLSKEELNNTIFTSLAKK